MGSLRVIKILSNCSIDTGPSVNAGFSVYLFVEQRSPVRPALFAHADVYAMEKLLAQALCIFLLKTRDEKLP